MKKSVQTNAGIINYAYHGTSRENAIKIVKNKDFRLSDGNKAFLGKGFYYYLYDMKFAVEWAKNKKNYMFVSVIVSKVDLGDMLNMDDDEHREMVHSIIKRHFKMNDEISEPQAIEIYIKKLLEYFKVNIDTVRKIFKNDDGSRPQEVISVRNTNKIIESSIIVV